jgi:hypothetical protein
MRGIALNGDTLRPAVVALALLCAVTTAVVGCARQAGPDAASVSSSGSPSARPTVAPSCDPTLPNGDTPPGEKPSRRYHGNGQIWTALWPRGTVVFVPAGPGEIRADGSLAMKFPFWRGPGVNGDLRIGGVGLDGAPGEVRGEAPEGYGAEGFQAAAIVFPGPGCWQVTARAGAAQLTFVTRVVLRE